MSEFIRLRHSVQVGGVVASAALFVLASTPLAIVAATNDARPNIVILYADDLGYGDLAIQNPDSKIPTPNLDQLSREGIRFSDAHSSSSVCTLSRYGMLTGRYHWRSFHGNADFPARSVFADELTLPSVLHRAGYRTACIGKWHLGWNWNAIHSGRGYDWSQPIPDGPLAHGFDYYFGVDVPNRPPYTWIENDRVVMVPTEPLTESPRPEEGRWETEPGPMTKGWRLDAIMPRLTKRAVEWIGEQKCSRQPFFLYFPWTSPHAPILPMDEFQQSSRAGPYGDYVVQSDAAAGTIMRTLDENGFRDNTIVIFTSDNGPADYAYERVRKYQHRSMGPFRGVKGDIWEGGHRVPFVVRWPGTIEPRRVSDALISQLDLFATIASAIGIELPQDACADSCDFMPLLCGDSISQRPRTMLVYNSRPDRYALRSDDWVLVNTQYPNITEVPDWYADANGYEREPPATALYDLRSDLGQHVDVSKRYLRKVDKLRAMLQDFVRSESRYRPD